MVLGISSKWYARNCSNVFVSNTDYNQQDFYLDHSLSDPAECPSGAFTNPVN
jgi:hypothetical protein